MPDIADDEEGRAAVASREMRDVVAALVVGALEGFVESGASTAAVAGFRRRGQLQVADALFSLQNEVRGFVEIDVVCDRGAVRCDAGDRAVEDIEVFLGIGRGGVRARNAEKIAELGKEHLVVRTLGRARSRPAGDEGINRSHSPQDTENPAAHDAKTKTFGINGCWEEIWGRRISFYFCVIGGSRRGRALILDT